MIGNDTMADLTGRMDALLLQEKAYAARDYLSTSHRAASSFESFPPSLHSVQKTRQVSITSYDGVSSSSSSPIEQGARKRRSEEISHEISPLSSPALLAPTSTVVPQAVTDAQLDQDDTIASPSNTHEIPPSPGQTNLVGRNAQRVAVIVQQHQRQESLQQYQQQRHRQERSVSPSGVDQFELHSSGSFVPTMQDWRAQISEWFFKVADSLSMSREIVAIACSYLDRHLSTFGDLPLSITRRTFQLVSLTCLYLATKLYDHKILPPMSIVNLSRGCFTAKDIEETERTVLNALQWRLSPPTPLTFVKHLLLLLPRRAVSRPVRRTISDVSKYLTELSVIDYFFVGRKSSSIGLAAILTAMDVATYEFELSAEDRLAFERAVYKMTGLDCRTGEVAECRLRLRNTYRQGGVYSPAIGGSAPTTAAAPTTTTVTTGTNVDGPSKKKKKKKRRFHTSDLFVSPRSIKAY